MRRFQRRRGDWIRASQSIILCRAISKMVLASAADGPEEVVWYRWNGMVLMIISTRRNNLTSSTKLHFVESPDVAPNK